jgi:serine/threonine-protein kinase
MTPDRDSQIERICQAALERHGSAREAFLSEACAGDEALQRDVESLLAQESKAVGFMSTPAAAFVSGPMLESTSFIGRHLGPYVIQTRLGAGGMASNARTTPSPPRRRHQNPAAALRATPTVSRFAEARLLASLNHPHIGAIYGLEDVDPLAGPGQAPSPP